MKKLTLLLLLITYSCGESPKKNKSNKIDNKFEQIRKQMIAEESTRWMNMADPKVSEFQVINDSTFNISSEFKHPFLEKDVKFIYQYYYNTNLDKTIKDAELVKEFTLVEGEYVEFNMFD